MLNDGHEINLLLDLWALIPPVAAVPIYSMHFDFRLTSNAPFTRINAPFTRINAPFTRITEVEQLQAARLLRPVKATRESGGLHSYEKGILYRILAKSRNVNLREIDFLLELPDPYPHVHNLAKIRKLLEWHEHPGGPSFGFAKCYRSERYRKRVTLSSMIFGGVYSGGAVFYICLSFCFNYPNNIQSLALFAVAGILSVCAAVAFFRWPGRMKQAENLIKAQNEFIADGEANSP